MVLSPVEAPTPPTFEATPIAGFWRRLAAFLVDGLILGVPALAFGFALFSWVASIGQAGRLIGFVVALFYFGLLNSRFGGGQTLGQRLFGIRVIDRQGQALPLMRSVMRFMVVAIPYFLNNLSLDTNATSIGPLGYLLATLLTFVVFGGLGAIVYLFVLIDARVSPCTISPSAASLFGTRQGQSRPISLRRACT